MPLIGVLALQGAFREHLTALRRVGARAVEIRRRIHIDGIDALVLPGGESTAIGKLLAEEDMFSPLLERLRGGMPVYGTCAGLILLCKTIEHSGQPRFGILDATVRRNAFGRQTDSFESRLSIPEVGEGAFPAVFIRAPAITEIGPGVRVLAEIDGRAVAVRQGNALATAFHPELTRDMRFHRYFAGMCHAIATPGAARANA